MNIRQSHTADDIVGLVRAFTKWDATPNTRGRRSHAFQEAYRQAMTPPCAPVAIVLDAHLQKDEAGNVSVPDFVPPKIKTISEQDAEKIAGGLGREESAPECRPISYSGRCRSRR